MKRTTLNKVGKSSCSKLEKKCDAFLTPIAKLKNPQCECCGLPTQVGHHFIEKSRSNFLRYDTENNIISLCNVCHYKIHNKYSVIGIIDVSDIIRKKRGEEWFNYIQSARHTTIKKDILWYQTNFERLTTILNS